MYGHERSLVKRLEGKPFALIGVNSDDDRNELKQVLIDERITWRSFWDGGKDGPIAEQWKLDGWPSIWVIDARGVIRYRDVFGPEMDQAVDTLLAEIDRGK
jgi:AhpC/TSA family